MYLVYIIAALSLLLLRPPCGRVNTGYNAPCEDVGDLRDRERDHVGTAEKSASSLLSRSLDREICFEMCSKSLIINEIIEWLIVEK